MIESKQAIINSDHILKLCCEYYNMPVNLVKSRTRKREIVQVRQIAMTLSMFYTDESQESIGLNYGNYDHATCINARKTVNNLLETDKVFRTQYDDIERRLKHA